MAALFTNRLAAHRGARPRNLRWALAALGLLAVSPAWADITLKLDKKDGEKVSDMVKIVAAANSSDGVDKVEFKLDSEPPVTDTSTPYEFEWDTLQATESKHTLTVTAFDSNGRTQRVTLTLEVDNELGAGAAALAQQGRDALGKKDYAEALKYARRSLKAEPGNVAGARVAAAAHAAKGEWSKALIALDNARGLDQSAEGMQEKASYWTRRALLPDNTANLVSDLQEIDALRRKAGDLFVKEAIQKNTPPDGKNSPQQRAAIGDALLNAGRFSEAAAEYGKAAQEKDAPLTLINRYALALVLSEKVPEAYNTLRPLILEKKADAASRAVYGLSLLRLHRFTESRAAVQPDIADQFVPALIVAAYADASLENRRDAIANARDAAKLLPQAGDAHYALALAAENTRDAEALRESDSAILRTLALAPAQNGPYLDYAARLLMQRRQDRFELALNLSDFVRKREPENVSARLMQTLIYIHNNRLPDAEAILKDLINKDQKSPDLLMALAVYWHVKGNAGLANEYLGRARMADSERFNPNMPEAPLEYLSRLYRRLHYRSGQFLTLTSLFPSEAAP